jgi:hypothetical protein
MLLIVALLQLIPAIIPQGGRRAVHRISSRLAAFPVRCRDADIRLRSKSTTSSISSGAPVFCTKFELSAAWM